MDEVAGLFEREAEPADLGPVDTIIVARTPEAEDLVERCEFRYLFCPFGAFFFPSPVLADPVSQRRPRARRARERERARRERERKQTRGR